VPRGGEELAHALARSLFVSYYSQRLSYPANKTGRCLLNAAPAAVPNRYSLTADPVCMRRLGGSGVSCGYSVTSCAIYLFDCVTVERGAFACKRARLCHLLCRSFAPHSSFLPSPLGPFNPRSEFTFKMLSQYGERSMVPLRSLSPFGRPMGYHNELSLRPYDDLEFRSYRWNVEPYDPSLWVSGSYSSCPGCSLCSSILAIVRLIYSAHDSFSTEEISLRRRKNHDIFSKQIFSPNSRSFSPTSPTMTPTTTRTFHNSTTLSTGNTC
jgi:hypothetical protein